MSEKFEKASAILKIKPSVASRVTTTITSSEIAEVMPLLEAMPGPSTSRAIKSPVKFTPAIRYSKSSSSVGSADGTEKMTSVTEEILWQGQPEDMPDITSLVKATNYKVRCPQLWGFKHLRLNPLNFLFQN